MAKHILKEMRWMKLIIEINKLPITDTDKVKIIELLKNSDENKQLDNYHDLLSLNMDRVLDARSYFDDIKDIIKKWEEAL